YLFTIIWTMRSIIIAKVSNHLSAAPSWFSWVYPKLFSLKSPAMQSIDYRDKSYGVLSLHPSHKEAITNAWTTLREVAIVSTVVILTTSLLMVFAMNIVIRPSRKIEKSIRALSNDLSGPPVPDFRINEWQSISLAINDFVQRLRLAQQKNQSLAEQLVRVQEDERRHISRELHDDLGQSLTGMLALSSLLTIKAQKSSPELAETAEKLTVTAQEMMNQMRNILFSLRLTDSLLHSGLDNSLHRLIHHWKARINSPIQLQYHNKAELSKLPESVQLNVFRVIQECLHNIYKHSDATQASVEISASPTKQQLHIIIMDNGTIEQLDFVSNPGFGISGIFERVAMLDGKIDFAIASPHGLVINVTIPIISSHSTTK
ncbi:two-component sensor histidine kinase, partial [Methylophaga lonarensis MPL]